MGFSGGRFCYLLLLILNPVLDVKCKNHINPLLGSYSGINTVAGCPSGHPATVLFGF